MEETMNELKRCPFCGVVPRTELRVTKMGGTEDHIEFAVHCVECGIQKTVTLRFTAYANFMDVEKAMTEVIKAWNQRKEENDGD